MKLFISFIYSTENEAFGMSNTILHAENFDLSALTLEKVREIEEEIKKNLGIIGTVRIINYKVI